MALFQVTYCQKSIDNLFEKYSDEDGFTSVKFSGNLLKMISDEDDDFPSGINEIRILAQENKNQNIENFYDVLINDINRNDYEEFMSVKESGQDLKMFVKTRDDKIKEFLLIGGGHDNVIIQVKGDMSISDARKFSQKIKNEHDLTLGKN